MIEEVISVRYQDVKAREAEGWIIDSNYRRANGDLAHHAYYAVLMIRKVNINNKQFTA